MFCKNLKTFRIMNNFSQKEIADKLNVSIPTIGHWETGYSEPKIAQILELAKIYSVTLDELFE